MATPGFCSCTQTSSSIIWFKINLFITVLSIKWGRLYFNYNVLTIWMHKSNLCRKLETFLQFESGVVRELWHIFQGQKHLKDWPISIMLLIPECAHMKKFVTRTKGFGNWESASAPGVVRGLHHKQAEK